MITSLVRHQLVRGSKQKARLAAHTFATPSTATPFLGFRSQAIRTKVGSYARVDKFQSRGVATFAPLDQQQTAAIAAHDSIAASSITSWGNKTPSFSPEKPNKSIAGGSVSKVGSGAHDGARAPIAESDESLLAAVAAAAPTAAKLTQSQQFEPYAVTTLHLTGPADEFWRKVPIWENVSLRDFLSNEWNVSLFCPSVFVGTGSQLAVANNCRVASRPKTVSRLRHSC